MILVTGASGLLGQHLIKQLSDSKHEVRALYLTSKPNIFLPRLQWQQADILDIEEINNAMLGIEQVYHCAARVSFNPKKREELFINNVQGTANIVNACLDAGIKKLVHVSSVASLGKTKENIVVDETAQWIDDTNNSQYARTKFLSEMEVWRGIGEGLNAVIVNPTIILGAGDWNKGSSEIFKSVYNEFPWYTNGSNGFVDVQDVAKAMILLMESEISNERFIISGHNLSYKELFTEIAVRFEKKPPRIPVTPLLAQLVWRVEAIKEFFTKKEPLLTKETARTAQAKVQYDNSKLLNRLNNFEYTPIKKTIERICAELVVLNNL